MHTLHATYYLATRALRESARQPGIELPQVLIPLFFFAVIVGAANNIAAEAFGVDNYIGFQLPVAMLQAVAGAATVSGIVLVTDMERGVLRQTTADAHTASRADPQPRER